MSLQNKNKRDNVSDNDNILKKQKLNGEEDGNSEIDITNLSKKKVLQLKSIALTLGISIKNGLKKNDIIEKIKKVYKIKQDYKDKQEHEKNINSFNKEIAEFKIKDGIDPLEWLFWRVFRNKIIYREIMSNMDTQFSTPYHLIISVGNMIEFNQLNLLRDKVIRNQYLTFGNCVLLDSNKFGLIFSAIKNNDDQDRLFYQQLFRHYGRYSMSFYYDREEFVNDIISSNCIPALQILIQQHQYIPTLYNLAQAIKCKRTKFVKLLLSTAIVTKTKFNIKGYIEELVNDIIILNQLFHHKLIDNEMAEKKLKEIISVLDFEKFNLKSLVIMSQLVLKLGGSSGGKNNISIEDIESFSNSLTKQELISYLSNPSNQIESKKKMIKKLIQLCYSYSNIKLDQLFNNYLGTAVSRDPVTVMPIFELPHAVYSSFLRFCVDLSLYFDLKDLPKFVQTSRYYLETALSRNPEMLFSHCKDDKYKQIKFIMQVIALFRKKMVVINSELFFKSIILNNDLNQVKEVANKMNIRKQTVNSYYIKSTLVLDWLFENDLIDSNSIWNFNTVELLQHYEKLYQLKALNNNGKRLISLPNYSYYSDDRDSKSDGIGGVEVLTHIFKSGSKVYENNKRNNKNLISFISSNSKFNEKDKFELMKLVYLNFNDGMDQLLDFARNSRCEFYTTPCYAKFMYWFFRNFNNEFDKLDMSLRAYFSRYIFLCPNYPNEKKEISLLQHIISYPNQINTEWLDIILKSTTPKSIKTLLYNACDSGQLKTIQYVHQNYSWLLIKRSPKNPNGLFKKPNKLLISSLKNNQIAVSDYLFNLMEIGKELEICSYLPKYYFRPHSVKLVDTLCHIFPNWTTFKKNKI